MAEALCRGKVGSEDLEIFKDKVFREGSLNNDILLFKLLGFLWEDMRSNDACLPRSYNRRRCYILLSQNVNTPH